MGNGQSQVITAANGETVLTKADIGKVSGLFPALYLGSTAIAGDGSQLTDEQCRAAVARIREPGLPTRKVKVVVGAKLVSVFNPETMVEIVRSSTPYITVRTQVGESSSSIVVWVEFYGVGVPRLYAAQTHKSAQASNLLAALNLAAKRAAKLPKPDPPVAVQPAANGAAGRTPNKSGEGEKRGMGQRTESMRVAPPVQDLPEQTFKVSYRGSVPVQSKAGVDVATSALQQIRGQRLKQRAILGVSAAYIKVVDAKTREVITKAHLPELTFVTIDGLSTRTIAYIIDSGLGVLNCHGLKARGAKEAKAITEAIGTAIVTASNDQSGKLRMASAESRALARNLSVAAVGEGDASAPLGLFQATYLATVHVEVAASANKQAICNDAAFALHTQETLANQEVALVISGEGMKACETQSAQVISNTPIQNMSYVTVVEDKKLVKGLKKGGIIPKDAPLFAFINHDGRLARTTCELFFCGTRARELCETIGVAFQAAKEDQKRRKQNPFAAISQAREKVTGPLFKRQVHRRDLKAKEVVGMGQFGEVYSATQMVRAPGGKEAITEIPRAVKLLRKGASAKDRVSRRHAAYTPRACPAAGATLADGGQTALSIEFSLQRHPPSPSAWRVRPLPDKPTDPRHAPVPLVGCRRSFSRRPRLCSCWTTPTSCSLSASRCSSGRGWLFWSTWRSEPAPRRRPSVSFRGAAPSCPPPAPSCPPHGPFLPSPRPLLPSTRPFCPPPFRLPTGLRKRPLPVILGPRPTSLRFARSTATCARSCGRARKRR